MSLCQRAIWHLDFFINKSHLTRFVCLIYQTNSGEIISYLIVLTLSMSNTNNWQKVQNFVGLVRRFVHAILKQQQKNAKSR